MSDRLIAQLDMDGTVADFDKEMIKRLNLIRNPLEPEVGANYRSLEKLLPYIKERIRLIMAEDSFWEDLPRFQLGFDILTVLDELGFDVCVLTKGPRSNPRAWSRKVVWCEKHLPGRDVTVTRRKGQVYGRVLVDDFPEYITEWLEYRPRGVVIMPANDGNKDFKHSRVTRYDGTNIAEVRRVLEKARDRK